MISKVWVATNIETIPACVRHASWTCMKGVCDMPYTYVVRPWLDACILNAYVNITLVHTWRASFICMYSVCDTTHTHVLCTWHDSCVCNASVTRIFHARNELRVGTTHTHPRSFSRTAFLCDITHSFVTRFGHRGWQAISCEGVGNGNSCASCHRSTHPHTYAAFNSCATCHRNTHTLPPSHIRRLHMCHNSLIRDLTQSSEVRVRQERVVFRCVSWRHTHTLFHTRRLRIYHEVRVREAIVVLVLAPATRLFVAALIQTHIKMDYIHLR